MKNITKEQYEQLPDFMKSSYSESDNGYIYDSEDIGALKRAVDHEKNKRKEVSKEKKELEAILADYKSKEEAKKEQDAIVKGDIDSLRQSYESKYSKDMEVKDSQISQLRSTLESTILGATSMELANDISVEPKLMQEFIRKRLTLDLDSGTNKVRVLDSDGKPSSLTLQDLKSEFEQNPLFSRLIKGSKASGGAKAETPMRTTSQVSDRDGNFMKLSPKDKVAQLMQEGKLK